MVSQRPTVYEVDEYEPTEFDAVLVQENTVVCLKSDPEQARVVPLDKVNHIDAHPDLELTGAEVPDTFFGGAEYAFADVEKFDRLREHQHDLESGSY